MAEYDAERLTLLRKHSLNRFAVRQRIRSPIAVVDVSVRAEAEAGEDRGGEVAGGVGIGGGVLAEAVAFAVDAAPLACLIPGRAANYWNADQLFAFAPVVAAIGFFSSSASGSADFTSSIDAGRLWTLPFLSTRNIVGNEITPNARLGGLSSPPAS